MKYKGETYIEVLNTGSGTTYYISPTGKCVSKKVDVHELNVFETDKGYQYVKFSYKLPDGRRKTSARFLHRLVAQTFIPNPDNKPEVNHKDGNKHNNRVDNLEWVTSKENKEHARLNNLARYANCEDSGKAVCTNDQIKEACELMVENKLSLNTISKKLNIPIDTLYQIRSRGIWYEITKDYTFPEDPVKDCKYNDDKVVAICELIKQGYGAAAISRMLNVGPSTVRDIKYGRSHKRVSKNYQF